MKFTTLGYSTYMYFLYGFSRVGRHSVKSYINCKVNEYIHLTLLTPSSHPSGFLFFLSSVPAVYFSIPFGIIDPPLPPLWLFRFPLAFNLPSPSFSAFSSTSHFTFPFLPPLSTFCSTSIPFNDSTSPSYLLNGTHIFPYIYFL